jgi:hypothetical protein
MPADIFSILFVLLTPSSCDISDFFATNDKQDDILYNIANCSNLAE